MAKPAAAKPATTPAARSEEPPVAFQTPRLGEEMAYFNKRFREPGTPRMARVTGFSRDPGCVHLTIQYNPDLDVLHDGKQPVAVLRNVPLGPAAATSHGQDYCIPLSEVPRAKLVHPLA